MQIYLQSKTLRSEEMRLKALEIEQWPFLQKLPEFLQRKVKRYQRYVWQENKGIDPEKFLNSIPKDLKKTIMRSLCLDTLKRVPIFEKMDEQIFDAICNRLKPVLHTDESYIIRKDEPIEEMLFLMQGNLLSITDDGREPGVLQTWSLKAGDYIGEELISWALDLQSSFNDLPTSRSTVKTLTEVEAFVLMADDLRFVVTQLRQSYRGRLRHIFRFYSIQWRTWATCYIQAAWRRYCKKKLEESLRAEEYMLQNELAEPGAIAPNLGVTIYATRFSANILRATRLKGKAEMLERVPAMLLQKPDEPDVFDEEPQVNSP